MRISEETRHRLKKPLGELQKDFREVRRLGHAHRIIAVGDICTLGLLAMGIRPHLAVYDHLFMRHRLDPGMVRVLELHYKAPERFNNPPGTLSERILAEAPRLLAKGGAVLIDGEEDLTALAFILAAGPKDIIVYGQPGAGMVLVLPDIELKRKIADWLGISREG
ncbi:MAG: DUF359 domain-containing protein [Candidatus Micrarchaeota archaeon]